MITATGETHESAFAPLPVPRAVRDGVRVPGSRLTGVAASGLAPAAIRPCTAEPATAAATADEFPDPRHAGLGTLLDDSGHTALLRQHVTVGVAGRGDDALRAEALGGEDGEPPG